MNKPMPLVFVGHGSPMNAVLDNPFTRSLGEAGKQIGKPRAVIVISAHWQSREMQITSANAPEQIYDFIGFPDELYRLVYRPAGSATFADEICSLCENLPLIKNEARGIDHGAWAVLKHMFPDANVPVLQISLDLYLDERGHYNAARKMAALRDNGFVVIGSGNIVHNLREMQYEQYAQPYKYAEDFDGKIAGDLKNNRDENIINYKEYGEIAERSVPTNEHYLPLLYVKALQREGEKITFVYEGIEHGSVSMRSFVIQ